MTAYQSQAVEPNVTPVVGLRPLGAIERLPAGDLFIALAAHTGRPALQPGISAGLPRNGPGTNGSSTGRSPSLPR